MKRRKRPGAGVGSPAGPKQTSNGDPFNANASKKLAVELVTAAEQDFAAKVMAQLPGLPQPLIWVLLNPPIKDDTQSLANAYGEPIAFVDMTGRLLTYRTPQ